MNYYLFLNILIYQLRSTNVAFMSRKNHKVVPFKKKTLSIFTSIPDLVDEIQPGALCYLDPYQRYHRRAVQEFLIGYKNNDQNKKNVFILEVSSQMNKVILNLTDTFRLLYLNP